MISKNDFTLKAGFAAVAKTNVTMNGFTNWNDKLIRNLRLLVPIDVQALAVAPGEKVTRAAIAPQLLEYMLNQKAGVESFGEDEIFPEPFTDLEDRLPGVYLHWSLPDGLTQGEVNADQETGEVESGAIDMNPLPNRWTVMRIEQGRPRKTTSWVIESEKAKVTDVKTWKETQKNNNAEVEPDPEAPPALDPERLTALAGGDETWSAVFDSVQNRFAFHDPLIGVENLDRALTYVVSGWYSEPNLDPLHHTNTITSFQTVLETMGWKVPDSDLERAQADAIKRKENTQSAGLKSGVIYNSIGKSDQAIGLPIAKIKTDLKNQYSIANLVLNPWWPQQTFFHGVIYGIQVEGQRPGDQRPDPADIDLSIGQTATESLASLVTKDFHKDEKSDAERIHNAFQYGKMDLFEEDDALPKIEEEMHRRGFESQSGGFIYEKIRSGDAFSHLRRKSSGHWPSDLSYQALGNSGLSYDGDQYKIPGKIQLANSGQSVAALNKVNTISDTPKLIQDGLKAKLNKNVNFEFVQAGLHETTAIHDWENQYAYANDKAVFERVADKVTDKITYKQVRRAMPRFFYPQEPVIVLRGLNRSLRHGYDGRYEADETVACRISGTMITSFANLIRGSHIIGERFQYGQLPPESEDIVYEAVLEDPHGLNDMVEVAHQKTGQAKSAIKKRFKAELALQRQLMVKQSQAVKLNLYSVKTGPSGVGREPSPVGITYWRQAWVPIYMEWEIELAIDTRLGDWKLDEVDFERNLENPYELARTLSGRSLLNSSSAKSLANEFAEFLTEEGKLDDEGDGIIDKQTEDLIHGMKNEVLYTDTLQASLESIRDQLLGIDSNLSLATLDSDDPEPPLNSPSRPPLLFAGMKISFKRMRVVDAFGRTLNVPNQILQSMSVGETLRRTKETRGTDGNVEVENIIMIPPRIWQPSRLMFRFIDATDDTRDVYIDQSETSANRNPVAAWLLPDHVDRALEIFDPFGEPLGQLRHSYVQDAVVWEGTPGHPISTGSSPNDVIQNRHAAEFTRSLIQRDVAERDKNDVSKRETPLNALLRVIDTTLWTVDPFGDTGTEHYSIFTGRPIAMVRARLKLEVISDVEDYPAIDDDIKKERIKSYLDLSNREFEICLGSLSKTNDGLLGYFIGNDFRKFYPVHSQVLKDSIKMGRHEGYLSSHSESEKFAKKQEEDSPEVIKPITSHYIESNPKLTIRPEQQIYLTLLLDPSGKIHASSGILPRKSISLDRDFIESALARIAPSFRIGPVLVDPTTIRMPRVTGLQKEQQWTHRDTPNSWRDDPLEAATQDALLPEDSAVVKEGYIRVSLETDE